MLGDRPVTSKEVPVIFVAFTLVVPLYTSYPVTATLSVDAVQDKVKEVVVILEALRLVGAEGGWTSVLLLTERLEPGITSDGDEVL